VDGLSATPEEALQRLRAKIREGLARRRWNTSDLARYSSLSRVTISVALNREVPSERSIRHVASALKMQAEPLLELRQIATARGSSRPSASNDSAEIQRDAHRPFDHSVPDSARSILRSRLTDDAGMASLAAADFERMSDFEQAELLATVSLCLARLKDRDLGYDVARWAEEVAKQAHIDYLEPWSDIARAYATLDRPTLARSAVRRLLDPIERAMALAAAAKDLALAGSRGEATSFAGHAFELSTNSGKPLFCGRGLAATAVAWAEIGNAEEARRCAEAAELSIPRDDESKMPYFQEQCANATLAYAVAGDMRYAVELAEAITNPYWQVDAFAAVAQYFAVGGDLDRARQFARRAEIAADLIYVEAHKWMDVARAFAACGDIDETLAIAQSAYDSIDQARTLAAAAEAIRFGEHGADVLIRTALQTGHWGVVIPALTIHDPKLALAICDEVLVGSGRHAPSFVAITVVRSSRQDQTR
jgi:hypothetical protein